MNPRNKTRQSHTPTSIDQINPSLHLQNTSKTRPVTRHKTIIKTDEAEYLTSEKYDPCAQKVTYTKEENKNTL